MCFKSQLVDWVLKPPATWEAGYGGFNFIQLITYCYNFITHDKTPSNFLRKISTIFSVACPSPKEFSVGGT